MIPSFCCNSHIKSAPIDELEQAQKNAQDLVEKITKLEQEILTLKDQLKIERGRVSDAYRFSMK